MDRFEIAKVLKPQGIKGELKLEAYTDDIDNLASVKVFYTLDRGEYVPHEVEGIRISMDIPYLKLKGIDTRNDAEEMRNRYLYIDREDASPLEEGEYYVADLIGMKVADENGNLLGTLYDVLDNGAGLIYDVRGERQMLIPDVPGLELDTDFENGVITVDSRVLTEVMVENEI